LKPILIPHGDIDKFRTSLAYRKFRLTSIKGGPKRSKQSRRKNFICLSIRPKIWKLEEDLLGDSAELEQCQELIEGRKRVLNWLEMA